MARCDDCRNLYARPVYYSFDVLDCRESLGDLIPKLHQNCTGNLCPRCADLLIPDDPFDPRRAL